jgi:hypothetical protein
MENYSCSCSWDLCVPQSYILRNSQILDHYSTVGDPQRNEKRDCQDVQSYSSYQRMASDCKGCSRWNGKRDQEIPHRPRKSNQSDTKSNLQWRKISRQTREEARHQDLEGNQSTPRTHENRSPKDMVWHQSHRLLGQRPPPQVPPVPPRGTNILVFSPSSIPSSPPSSISSATSPSQTSSPASKPSSAAFSSTSPNYCGQD